MRTAMYRSTVDWNSSSTIEQHHHVQPPRIAESHPPQTVALAPSQVLAHELRRELLKRFEVERVAPPHGREAAEQVLDHPGMREQVLVGGVLHERTVALPRSDPCSLRARRKRAAGARFVGIRPAGPFVLPPVPSGWRRRCGNRGGPVRGIEKSVSTIGTGARRLPRPRRPVLTTSGSACRATLRPERASRPVPAASRPRRGASGRRVSRAGVPGREWSRHCASISGSLRGPAPLVPAVSRCNRSRSASTTRGAA